ncbi:MAG TPA: 50S ribosomal protein L23 [Eubacteriales bacterium]|jgi:large subunit ribosomal protein L23|nr:50S ribosomal protein L23 [Clostridia bacterium]HRV73407.1 50S ribosomal protein L23 [Eubacteriales bacterium]
MKSAYDIIKAPILTEKSYDHIGNKTYTFEVATDANKVEIRKAIEEIFGVKVKSVNTINRQGKLKRQGRYEGRRASTKKAYITLAEGSKGIEMFDGIAQ